jgi:hypothetical protein
VVPLLGPYLAGKVIGQPGWAAASTPVTTPAKKAAAYASPQMMWPGVGLMNPNPRPRTEDQLQDQYHRQKQMISSLAGQVEPASGKPYVEGKAANLRTFAMDEPGHGGACHKYEIDGPVLPSEGGKTRRTTCFRCSIRFPKWPDRRSR